MVYKDRTDAGKKLAEAVSEEAGKIRDGIVLALPRGGVPVADEVAKKLDLPLSVVVVRKLGHPNNPEYAIGAIASGGGKVLHDEAISRYGITHDQIQSVLKKEKRKLKKREELYHGKRIELDIEGKTVLLVDDGIATGASMQVAVSTLRNMNLERLIIAVPVGPPDTIRKLREIGDDVICPLQPTIFGAIGRFYRDFSQVSNDEVRQILAKYRTTH